MDLHHYLCNDVMGFGVLSAEHNIINKHNKTMQECFSIYIPALFYFIPPILNPSDQTASSITFK